MDKLYAIQEVFISVQSALDEVASYGERIKKWVKVKKCDCLPHSQECSFLGVEGVGGAVLPESCWANMESDRKSADIIRSCYIHPCFYFGKQHSLYVAEG